MPNSMVVPSLVCEPDSAIVPSSTFHFLDRFQTPVSDDDSEDENPPSPTHIRPITSTPCFLDGSIQHVKQLVILSVILDINVEHVLSSRKSLLFWLKFMRIMILKLLQKL